jgi:pimeloyl-ACP methyl ester carboxylesterase
MCERMETTGHDVRLSWVAEGRGAEVLLIHGHTLDHRIWEEVAVRMRQAELRTLAYDLRGHGRSSRPESGYHWSNHAADVAAVMDAAGCRRCAVAGYSIGGGIALELALTMPERVRRLALLSPVLPDRPFEQAFFDNLREVASVVRSQGVRRAMLGPWLDSPLWEGSLETPGVRARLEEIVADFPGAEYLARARDRVEREWAVPERLGEIAAPTLVAVGERELPGFRSWASEIATGIPGARFEVLAGLGHLHLLQDPDRVAALLIRHLAD